MSSAAPPSPFPAPAPPRPGPAPAGGGLSAAIDPVKLLKKWKYVLVGSVAVGLVFGVVAHVVWNITYPFFESNVVYEALPPQDETLLQAQTIDEDAMDTFMATEAGRMMSPTVLERVARDPRLLSEAPKWSGAFVEPDGSFDWRTAMEELEKRAEARPVGGTFNIELKVMWRDKQDVTALARLLREAYLNVLSENRGVENRERRDAIQRAIDDLRQEVQTLTERRSRLIRDNEVSSISEQAATTRGKLQLIAQDRNEIQLMLQEIKTALERMDEMVQSESGVRYSDTQRATAESRPIIQGMKNEKESLETRLNELRRSNFMPSHREYKRVERSIAAIEQQISISMERELAVLFDAEKDMLESQRRALDAQNADLLGREELLEKELEDLTRTIREINDITNEIGALNRTLADRRSSLADLETTTSLGDASNRIRVVERERIPERPTLPNIFLMIPLGVILVSGLVTGTILAAEFLDQRIKSPSDLAAMPRTKILGTIPLAGEDPGATSNFETVFRDADRSVVAESFRQVRTSVAKAMDEGGHKTVLVVSAMPGSGSTSMVTNLGFALAAVDRRVLLIDANFRRPALHRVFGTPESPGLGDVLAGEVALEDAVREVGPNLFVLPVGSTASRVFERLNTEPMTALLARVKGEFDAALLDTAPAVVSGDASALAQRCDASILVTRALAEKRGMVARIKNEMSDASASMLGVVLNAVRSAAGGYMKRNIRTSTAYHAGPRAGRKPGGKPGNAKNSGA